MQIRPLILRRPPQTPNPRHQDRRASVLVSDVAHLQWNKLDSTGLPKIITSANVQNDDSLDILAAALTPPEERDQTLIFDLVDHYEGLQRENKKYWVMTTDEGKTILASPNERGAAILLAQHKWQFGRTSTIKRV